MQINPRTENWGFLETVGIWDAIGHKDKISIYFKHHILWLVQSHFLNSAMQFFYVEAFDSWYTKSE